MMLGQTFTDASLISAMHNTFGDDAKYYSCSQNDMTAEQLIAFLKSKGKFVEVDAVAINYLRGCISSCRFSNCLQMLQYEK